MHPLSLKLKSCLCGNQLIAGRLCPEGELTLQEEQQGRFLAVTAEVRHTIMDSNSNLLIYVNRTKSKSTVSLVEDLKNHKEEYLRVLHSSHLTECLSTSDLANRNKSPLHVIQMLEKYVWKYVHSVLSITGLNWGSWVEEAEVTSRSQNMAEGDR